MTDLTLEALDALQERLRRIEWGVTGEPCAAGNVDETAALEADTAITALRARLSLYEGSTGPVSVSGIVQDMEGTLTALRDQLAVYEAAGIVEIAARNPSVMEYVRHWEGRAERAEAQLATARADAVRETASVARQHIYYDSAGTGFQEEAFDNAITALRAQLATPAPSPEAVTRAALDGLPATRVGEIENYYGGLWIKCEGGQPFWCIEGYASTDWKPCPEPVFLALAAIIAKAGDGE
jgi:hypothetical protein